MRNSASPTNVPAMPVAMWSLTEGGVFSPKVSQPKLPPIVYSNDSQ